MIIGNKDTFGFEIKKESESEHTSKLTVFANGKNICEYIDSNGNKRKNIFWDNDELISYLNDTINFFYENDPFPVQCRGDYAAELDNNARDFDSENEDELDSYFDKLNDWSYKHSWRHARSGAIVPDLLFRVIDNQMEISWWTDYSDEGLSFTNSRGFILVEKNKYIEIISNLFDAYNDMWK
ncbi:MAG: hypothetical protein IJ875_07000 [Solobacterium sp.]|nr:hypothetical protein [Solobacterium sp.]